MRETEEIHLNVVGIVAEYNPFHNGHRFHAAEARRAARADAVAAVVSSHFVQRGEPAMTDKYVRASMALHGGVDLVLELPVVYACHNAGPFANAAIDILNATGQIGALCFGMETPESGDDMLERIADILNDEPDDFKTALRSYLAEGYSFVQARSMALDQMHQGAQDVLKRPNNNLALAYVKRIRERGYAMRPIPIRRIGADYHDKTVGAGDIASATALRELIRQNRPDEAAAFMPEQSISILRQTIQEGHAVTDTALLWRALKQALVRSTPEELARIAEMREGIENRLLEAVSSSASFESFVDACTSRRYPKGRIQRYCMHALLNLGHEENRTYQEQGPAYIRVLGANETGRQVLSLMRKSATLPVVSRASAPWNPYAAAMMRMEHRAAEIWELLTPTPRIRAEARATPVMLDTAS